MTRISHSDSYIDTMDDNAILDNLRQISARHNIKVNSCFVWRGQYNVILIFHDNGCEYDTTDYVVDLCRVFSGDKEFSEYDSLLDLEYVNLNVRVTPSELMYTELLPFYQYGREYKCYCQEGRWNEL